MKIPLLTWIQTTKLLILMNFKTWMLAAIWFTLTKISEKLLDLFLSNIPSNIANFPTEASAREELKKLCDRADRIRARLHDAEQNRRIEAESVLLWLSELRSIAFEAEDLNEEFDARVRAREASSWYCRRMKNRIDEINERYNTIYNDKKSLRELKEAPGIATTRNSGSTAITSTNSPETSSLEGIVQLRGRHDENELLRSLLLEESNSTHFPPVISIIGEGGIGKTALAQSAFNHPEISEHFKPLIWISLPAIPDPVETIKRIIEAINGTNCNLSTLDVLQRTLQQLLRGKKFLLVLDGVYTDTNAMFFWDPVWIPLSMAESGSKILATTRNQRTAQYMGSSYQYQVTLSDLNSSFLWLVLKDEAFPHSPVPENLECIGKEIATKCYGSPLVARLLGRALRGRTEEEEWSNLLKGMPNPFEVVGNVLPFLKRSYELLPLHLKRCFAYCSIFPKGYEFDRDHLVKLWMSEGLLKCERLNARTLEDIGRKQFNDLLWRSFFQPCGQLGGCDQFVMPGAIHDLAESVSMYECARVGHSGIQHPKPAMARYAYICGDNLKHESLNNIYDKEYLRTLIITGGPVLVISILQQKLSSNLKCLRSLDMSKCKVDKLHESIGNLIHLRFLNLSGSLFESLPESICKLLNLQTLNLDDCDNLKELPKGMCNLINMRHIGLSLNWEKWNGKDFDSMPPELGRLTSLQTLSRFSVSKQDGCGITELKDLKLSGDLCISNLENVENGRDARDANLWNKALRELRLRWRGNSANEEEVIMQLRPSNAIRCICIEGYNGSKLPDWVTEPSFGHLEMLKLFNCKVCDNLPQIATLPQLKRLYLLGLHKVRDINDLVGGTTNSVAFPSLELLHLSDMLELEKWFVVPNGSLTKLCDLSISNCPKLEEISDLPPSLTRFEVRKCRALKLPSATVPSLSNVIVEGVDLTIIEWVQNLTSLTSLSIIEVSELKCITEGDLRCLSGLTMLKIDGCNKFESFARNVGTQDLPSLKKLEISHCARFQLFSDQGLPDQIEELYLKGLKSLDKVPEKLDQLGQLYTLEIYDVPKLPFVPMVPSGLHFLTIKGCPKVEKKFRTGGQDWDKVKHVHCWRIGDATNL